MRESFETPSFLCSNRLVVFRLHVHTRRFRGASSQTDALIGGRHGLFRTSARRFECYSRCVASTVGNRDEYTIRACAGADSTETRKVRRGDLSTEKSGNVGAWAQRALPRAGHGLLQEKRLS